MPALPPVLRAARHAAAMLLVVLAALMLAVVGAGQARAAGTGAAPRVHHMLPENGAVLPAAPDHVEIMFDVDLVPGQVAVGVAPDGTGRLIALPGPPVLDGPVLVQPLPRLPAGHYTVGVQIRGSGGQLARGVFGFAVDPAAPPASTAADAGSGPSAPGRWLVPVVGAALLLPAAAGVAMTRRRRRAPRSGPASPGRAGGRTPTSASSPADPPRR